MLHSSKRLHFSHLAADTGQKKERPLMAVTKQMPRPGGRRWRRNRQVEAMLSRVLDHLPKPILTLRDYLDAGFCIRSFCSSGQGHRRSVVGRS